MRASSLHTKQRWTLNERQQNLLSYLARRHGMPVESCGDVAGICGWEARGPAQEAAKKLVKFGFATMDNGWASLAITTKGLQAWESASKTRTRTEERRPAM